MNRKGKGIILNLVVIMMLVWYLPFWTPTNGVKDIASGSTPPLGVVRDGPQVILWDQGRIGLYIVIQGIFLIYYIREKNIEIN
ncbi:MAG: hypothetical protein RR565_00595 [Erysipelothrix sp.]